MRRFYAPLENISEGSVTLAAEETRHLRDVLRQREGGEVRVFDGDGHEYAASIESISKRSAALKILCEVSPSSPESPLDLTLAAAILKGEKFDLVVQKSVELGVTRVVPLLTARCDVKPKDVRTRVERWRRISLEASKQSGRAVLMKISEPVGFRDLVKEPTGGKSFMMFSERGGEELPPDSVSSVTAVVGPEGGWEDDEIDAARRAGWSIVTLGGRILRAETAAIAVAAVLQHRFGDLR